MKLWNILITVTFLLLFAGCSDEDPVEKFESGNYIPVDDAITYTMDPDAGDYNFLQKVTADSTIVYPDTVTIYVVADDSVSIYENETDSTTVVKVSNDLAFSKGLLGLEADTSLQKEILGRARQFADGYIPLIKQQYPNVVDEDIDPVVGDDITIVSVSQTKDGDTGLLYVTYKATVRVDVSVPLEVGGNRNFGSDFTVHVTRTFETFSGTVPPVHWPEIK